MRGGATARAATSQGLPRRRQAQGGSEVREITIYETLTMRGTLAGDAKTAVVTFEPKDYTPGNVQLPRAVLRASSGRTPQRRDCA